MLSAYAPVMSTSQNSPRPPPATTPQITADGDRRRSEAFWTAFGDAPVGTERWMDSAATAWERPLDSSTLEPTPR